MDHTGSRPTLMTSFFLDSLSKGLVSKDSHSEVLEATCA